MNYLFKFYKVRETAKDAKRINERFGEEVTSERLDRK